METDIIASILRDLTQLLAEGLSPQTISYRFEKIATSLRLHNLSIDKSECREYYDDVDLALILLMKNEALAIGQFEHASKFRLLEVELLLQKGNSKSYELKTEPFFFEGKGNCVIFHYNKNKVSQRLIANLIEGYNLVHSCNSFCKVPTY